MSKERNQVASYDQIMSEEKLTKQDESVFLKLLDESYSSTNIEMKTDLNAKSIKAIAQAKAHHSIFNDPLINDLANNIMILSVSKGRQGRKEWTEIAKQTQSAEQEEKRALSGLLGRGL